MHHQICISSENGRPEKKKHFGPCSKRGTLKYSWHALRLVTVIMPLFLFVISDQTEK